MIYKKLKSKPITKFLLILFIIFALPQFTSKELTASAEPIGYTGFISAINSKTGVFIIKTMYPNLYGDEQGREILSYVVYWADNDHSIPLYQIVSFDISQGPSGLIATNVRKISRDDFSYLVATTGSAMDYFSNINDRFIVSGMTEVGETVEFSPSGLNTDDIFTGWYSTDSTNYDKYSVNSTATLLSTEKCYTITESDIGKYLFTKVESTNKPNLTTISTKGFSSPVTAARKMITNDMIQSIADQYYRNSAVTLNNYTLVVKDGQTTLIRGTDYEVSYSVNTNVGTAKVIVTGIGKYKGTANADFTIKYYDGVVTPIYNGTPSKAEWYTGDVTITADNYTISDSLSGTYRDTYVISGEKSHNLKLFFKQKDTGYVTDSRDITVSIDSTPPTGSITLHHKQWQNLLPSVSFKQYKSTDKTISISASDSLSGMADTNGIQYAIVTGDNTYETVAELEAAGLAWMDYISTSKPIIEADSKSVIYARLTDNAGNVSYLGSEGILLDETAPVISHLNADSANITDTSASINYQVDEASTMYMVAVPISDSNTYTPADIIATCNNSDLGAVGGNAISNVIYHSTVTVTEAQAATELSETLNGLSTNSAYRVYATAADKILDLDNTIDDQNPVYTTNVAKVQTLTFTTAKAKQDYTVTASIKTASGGTISAQVSGQGTYAEGATATLTAKPGMGCSFVKWTSDAEGINVVSTDRTNAITVNNSSTYYAWFKPDTYILIVGGYDPSFGIVFGMKPEGYTYNEEATLTAIAHPGYAFNGWRNEYGVTVTTDSVISLKILGTMIITPIFTRTEENVTYYTAAFYHQSGNLLKSEKIAENNIIMPPNTPSKIGYDFIGWSIDGKNPIGLNDDGSITITSNMIFRPLFKEKEDTYSLTVNGVQTSYAPLSSVIAQVVQSAVPEGKQFAYWSDKDGKIISYSNPYTFSITGNIELTAVYENSTKDIIKTPTLTLSAPTYEFVTTGKHKMIWYASMDLPEGYTLVESGILRVVSTTPQTNEQMTFDSVGVYRRIIPVSNSIPNQYYYSVTATDGIGVSVRAYIVVRDKYGNLETIFSNVEYGIV